PELVSDERQLMTQFVEFSNLAVKYDPVTSISRRHGLGAPGEINNGQPTMCEAHTRPHPDAFSVRASVGQSSIHFVQGSFGGARRQFTPVSCYSAHNLCRL